MIREAARFGGLSPPAAKVVPFPVPSQSYKEALQQPRCSHLSRQLERRAASGVELSGCGATSAGCRCSRMMAKGVLAFKRKNSCKLLLTCKSYCGVAI